MVEAFAKFLKEHNCEVYTKGEFLGKEYTIWKCYNKSGKPFYVAYYYFSEKSKPRLEVYEDLKELINDLCNTIILAVEEYEALEKLNKEKKL